MEKRVLEATTRELSEQEELEEDVSFCYLLWEKMWEEMIESKDPTLARYKEIFAKKANVKPGSPLAIAFAAFCGGISVGIDIARE